MVKRTKFYNRNKHVTKINTLNTLSATPAMSFHVYCKCSKCITKRFVVNINISFSQEFSNGVIHDYIRTTWCFDTVRSLLELIRQRILLSDKTFNERVILLVVKRNQFTTGQLTYISMGPMKTERDVFNPTN